MEIKQAYFLQEINTINSTKLNPCVLPGLGCIIGEGSVVFLCSLAFFSCCMKLIAVISLSFVKF